MRGTTNAVQSGGGDGLKVVAHGTSSITMSATQIPVTSALFAIIVSVGGGYDPCLATRNGYINSSESSPKITAVLSQDGNTLTFNAAIAAAPIPVEYWAFG